MKNKTEKLDRLKELKIYIGEVVASAAALITRGYIYKTHLIILLPNNKLRCIEKENWDGLKIGTKIIMLRCDEMEKGLKSHRWDKVIEKIAKALEKNETFERVSKELSVKKQMKLFDK